MAIYFNRFKPRFLTGVFLYASFHIFAPTASAQSDEWTVFTELKSLSFSESFSISDILGDIEGGGFADGGTDIFTFNEWTLGARRGPWELSLISRLDYVIDHTPDTAFLFLANETLDIIPNGDFDVFVNVIHSRNNGVRLGYTHDITPSLSVTGRISGLIANNIIDGTLSGQISTIDGEVSEGALGIDYVFTEDVAFDRIVDSETGYGFALDALIDWQVSDKLNASFAAYDFVSRIFYNDIIQTVADATTAISSTNDEGFLLVRPILSGQNFFEPFTQQLRRRFTARLDYDVSDKWRLSQDIFRTGDNHLTQSEVSYSFGNDLKLAANYEWVSGAIGLGVSWKYFHLNFATDSLDVDNARFARLNVGLKASF